jgi:O-antigen/teichoic acid export membrane protein
MRDLAGAPVLWWSNARKLTWVLSGKLALMSANAALMLLLAKHLDLKLYGLLVAAISSQLLLSRLLILGLDGGMIRLRTVPELHQQSQKVVQMGLLVVFYAIGAFALILLIIALTSLWTAVPHWPLWLVSAIFAGAVGTALVDYNYSYRLSELEYRAAGLIQSGIGIVRFALTAAVVLLFPAYPLLVFFAYPAASLLSGVGLTVAMLREGWLRPDYALMRRLLRFSFWLGAANMTIILSLYQGTFLLILLGQEAETGIFGLCLTFSLGFFTLYNAYGEYLLPRMARLKTPKELQRFLARALGGGLVIAITCVPVVMAMGMILPKLLRPELQAMSATFYLLAVSMLLLIVQGPLECTCIYLLRPDLMVLGWMLRVLCAVLLGVALANRWGAMGAAVAQLGAAVAALVVFVAFVGLQTRAGLGIRALLRLSRLQTTQ